MYKNRMLDFEPGTLYCYSNYGYLLAGMVVEKLSGLSFIDYVNQKILQPAGLAPVHVSTTAEARRPPMNLPYEDNLSGLTADPSSNQAAPAAYGGDQMLLEVADCRYRLPRLRTGSIYPSLQSLGQRHPGPIELTERPLQGQGRKHAWHFLLGRVAVG